MSSDEEEEFRLLYEQAFPLAYRVGYRYSGRRDEAEEAAQEAFARAFQRWGRLHGQPWIVGWILSTTLNILRKKARRIQEAPAQSPQDTAEHDVEASLDLWNAIRRLPKRQAQAVLLYYVADLPVKQVANAMGCREGSAKTHLSRARTRLADFLALSDRTREE